MIRLPLIFLNNGMSKAFGSRNPSSYKVPELCIVGSKEINITACLPVFYTLPQHSFSATTNSRVQEQIDHHAAAQAFLYIRYFSDFYICEACSHSLTLREAGSLWFAFSIIQWNHEELNVNNLNRSNGQQLSHDNFTLLHVPSTMHFLLYFYEVLIIQSRRTAHVQRCNFLKCHIRLKSYILTNCSCYL